MEENIRFNKNSELVITKVVRVYIDENGRKVRELAKFIAKEPIDLGSVNNPKNDEIVGFEWNDKKRPSMDESLFGFRG